MFNSSSGNGRSSRRYGGGDFTVAHDGAVVQLFDTSVMNQLSQRFKHEMLGAETDCLAPDKTAQAIVKQVKDNQPLNDAKVTQLGNQLKKDIDELLDVKNISKADKGKFYTSLGAELDFRSLPLDNDTSAIIKKLSNSFSPAEEQQKTKVDTHHLEAMLQNRSATSSAPSKSKKETTDRFTYEEDEEDEENVGNNYIASFSRLSTDPSSRTTTFTSTSVPTSVAAHPTIGIIREKNLNYGISLLSLGLDLLSETTFSADSTDTKIKYMVAITRDALLETSAATLHPGVSYVLPMEKNTTSTIELFSSIDIHTYLTVDEAQQMLREILEINASNASDYCLFLGTTPIGTLQLQKPSLCASVSECYITFANQVPASEMAEGCHPPVTGTAAFMPVARFLQSLQPSNNGHRQVTTSLATPETPATLDSDSDDELPPPPFVISRTKEEERRQSPSSRTSVLYADSSRINYPCEFLGVPAQPPAATNFFSPSPAATPDRNEEALRQERESSKLYQAVRTACTDYLAQTNSWLKGHGQKGKERAEEDFEAFKNLSNNYERATWLIKTVQGYGCDDNHGRLGKASWRSMLMCAVVQLGSGEMKERFLKMGYRLPIKWPSLQSNREKFREAFCDQLTKEYLNNNAAYRYQPQ